jgi:hypothetical protein
MSDWNFQELKELCESKKRPYPYEYIESLYWKKQLAEIHAAEAKRVWKELFECSFALGDEKYSKAHLVYAANIECCAHCLHSMVDLLMQIINSTVLNGEFKEEDVKFWSIYKTIKSNNNKIYRNILNSLDLLVKDEAYNYLSAFNNINKHRKLIKSDFHAEYGEKCRNEQDIVFREFTYNSKEYPRTWGRDIIEKYRTDVISLICDVGQSVNDFVRDY